MPCEMCGKEAPLKTAVIEGNKMRVCPDCAKFGTVVSAPGGKQAPAKDPASRVSQGMESRAKRQRSRDVFSQNEKVLAEDYGDLVRQAREKMDLTPEELSDQINEKKSVISHVEHYEHHPSDKLVQKLERALGITLMVKPEHAELVQSSKKKGSAGPVTIGDLLKDAMESDES